MRSELAGVNVAILPAAAASSASTCLSTAAISAACDEGSGRAASLWPKGPVSAATRARDDKPRNARIVPSLAGCWPCICSIRASREVFSVVASGMAREHSVDIVQNDGAPKRW